MSITMLGFFYNCLYLCHPPYFRSFSLTCTTAVSLHPSISFYSLEHHFRFIWLQYHLPKSLPHSNTFTGSPFPTVYNPHPSSLHVRLIPCILPFLPKVYPTCVPTRGFPMSQPHMKCLLPASMSSHMLFPLPRWPSLPLYLWSPTFLKAQLPHPPPHLP